MFQPFVPFEIKYLAKLLNLRRHHFVMQSYNRAERVVYGIAVTNLLVTEYDNPGLAIVHFNAVSYDKNASLLNISKDNDLKFFLSILSNEPPKLGMSLQANPDIKPVIDKQKDDGDDTQIKKYKVFFNLVMKNQELEKYIRLNYKEQFRCYIYTKTKWSLKRSDMVNVKLDHVEITFGELFVILRWGEQALRIKFEDIENCS